jgi:hypothetical protein
MVRSDQSCSGVKFTLDTESGFRDVVDSRPEASAVRSSSFRLTVPGD